MVKREDLVDIGDDDYQQRQDEFMQCQECSCEFGGTQGDYFTIHMDCALYCPDCQSENIAIVKAARVITIIKQ